MRFLAVVFLAGLCAAQIHRPPVSYSEGQEYVYKYKGRLLTGLPELAAHYAGMGIHCNVHLAVAPGSIKTYHIRVTDAKFAKVNGKVEPKDGSSGVEETFSWRQVDIKDYMPVPTSAAAALASPVVFSVSRESGELESLHLSESHESEWSVNFKKALVVLFKTQGIPTIPSENRISSSEMIPAWETMEESLEGFCKVDYQMRELPKYMVKDRPDLVKLKDLHSAGICQHESVKFYEIVRSRDLSSCTRRFAFTFYKPGRLRCSAEDSSAGASPNCEGMMSKSSVTRYIACGSSVDSLTTATILNEGETAVALLGIKAEKFLSGAKQTLRLVSKSEASSISLSSPSGSSMKLKSLHFEYKLKKTSEMGGETVGIDLEGGKGSLVSKETELLPRHLIARGYSEDEAVRSGAKVEHIIDQIKDMIREMVREDFDHTANLPAKEVTMKALGVASGFSMLSKEQIIDVFHSLKEEMGQNGEKMKKTFINVFIDTVMMSGTRAAILFLEEKLHELDQYTLVSAFTFLPTYLMVPKVPTLEVMLRMVESEPLKHMPLAKGQAVMATALLTQRACIASNKDASYPIGVYGEFCHPESPFVVARIIPFLQMKLESASSSEERNLYLVALGIIGHRDVVPVVLPYLEKTKPVETKDAEAREEKELEVSKMSRFLALYSLIKTGEYYPGSVEAIIFSVIANPAESSDLRVAAINSLIRLNPSEVYFHRLAALTWSDKDTKVIETINTALYTLSVNRNYEPLATVKTSAPHKAWLVYPLTKKITFRGGSKIPFASTLVMGDKLERLNTGFYDVTSYFMSDKSFVPLDFYHRMVNLINRYEVTPLEFGGRIKGFENLAQQLIELVTPAGVQNESRESFAAKVKANLTPELKSIIEQLGLERSRIESESSHKGELATIYSAFETTPLFRTLKSESADELLHKIGKIFGKPHISKSEIKALICQEHPINIQRLVDFAPAESAIPSEMGFPILMEVHAPTVAAMRGHVKIECEGMVPKVTVKAKANLASQLVGFIGTVIPFTSEFALATVDEHSVMGAPIIIETEFKPIEHKLTIKIKPDEDINSIDKVDIFHYHIRPFTALTKIGDIKPVVLKHQKIKVIKSKGIEKNIRSSSYIKEMTGLEATLKTESAFVDLRGIYEKLRLFNMNPMNALRFWWASVGLSETQKPSLRSHEYKLMYKPSSSGPKEMRMDIKLDTAYLARGSDEVIYRSVKLIESESEKSSSWPEWKKALPLKVEEMPISRVPSIHSDKARKAEEMIKQKLGTGIKEGKTIILTVHTVLSSGVSGRPMTYGFEIIYGTGMTSLKSKWNIVMNSLTNSYKMCIKGEMDVPSRMAAFDIEQLRSTSVSMDFNTEIGMGWHGNCDSSKIKIIGITKRSEEQKEWSGISPEAKQLEKLRRTNSPIKETSTVANAVRRQASSMDELKLTFKYEHVSPQVLKVTEMVSDYVQASLWPYYIVGSTSSSNGISEEPAVSETTEWRLKFSPHTPTFNMTVAVPRVEGQAMGNVHKFAHVRMPEALSYLMDYPLSAADLVAKQVQGSSKMIGSFPTCAIEETDFIRTYANATYKLKLDNCFHLAVADNSYNRQFAILVKEISPAKKVAKVIIEGKTTLEIEGDLSNPIVKVNGVNLQIQNNEKKPILDRSRKQVADIIRYSDNTLSLQAVYSPLLAGGAALIVKIQGGKLLLETSPAIFPEGVKGLCGSPSSAKLMAPAGPTSCYYSHPKVLAASYRLPELEGSSCPPLPEIVAAKLREENAKCTKAKVLPTKVFKSYNSLMNGSGSEQIPCTRHVHEMFERSTEVCFSRRPVTKCSAACRPASGALIEKSVSFGCISKERRVAELYAAKVRRGQILPELASLPERFSASTQLPRSCIRI